MGPSFPWYQTVPKTSAKLMHVTPSVSIFLLLSWPTATYKEIMKSSRLGNPSFPSRPGSAEARCWVGGSTLPAAGSCPALTEVEAPVPADELQRVHQLPAAEGLRRAVRGRRVQRVGQESQEQQQHPPGRAHPLHLGTEGQR